MGAVLAHYPRRIELEEVLPTLRTGDLLLFSGETVMSYAIELLTRCRWSHVAIVVWHNGVPLLLEAAISAATAHRDLTTGEQHAGVRLVDARSRISEYLGPIAAVRHLRFAARDDGSEDDEPRRRLKRFLLAEAGTLCREGRYDTSVLTVLRAIYPTTSDVVHACVGCCSARSSALRKSYQCASLIVHCLQRGGVLDTSLDCHDFTPEFFAECSDRLLNRCIDVPGCSYGPEVNVRVPNARHYGQPIL